MFAMKQQYVQHLGRKKMDRELGERDRGTFHYHKYQRINKVAR